MSDAQREVIRTWVEEVINKGNLSALDEIAHPEYVYRSPDEELHGVNAIKDFFAMFRSAFPDLYLQIDDLVLEGDKSVNCFTLTGTHEGDFMGIAATGNPVKVHGMVLSRFKDGKIIEEWEVMDQLALFQQIGVVSLPT